MGHRCQPCHAVFVSILLILSVTGCAHAPALQLPSMQLTDPAFFPTLEAYTQAPIVGGNRVDILVNGDQIFPAIVAAIRSARTTINYAQFAYLDGPVSDQVTEALSERCRAGVEVNLLVDGVGSFNMPTDHRDRLAHAGCHLAIFRPLTPVTLERANNRLHRRILVVDGRVGFAGGAGLGRAWMGDGRSANHWRDTDARIEGPAVAYLQGAFVDSWLKATGIVLAGEAFFPRLDPVGSVATQVVGAHPRRGATASTRCSCWPSPPRATPSI